MSDPIFNKIYEFRQTARQMERQANKSKQDQDLYTKKIKEAIQKNDVTMAKQYGEKALRARADATRYRTLSSKMSSLQNLMQLIRIINLLLKWRIWLIK